MSDNRILNTIAILSESFRALNIEDDGTIDITDSNRYLHLFDNVEDFRQTGKIAYKLSDILMLSFLVITIEGKRSFYAIADYIEMEQAYFEELGLIHDGRVPSHDTFRRVFEYLDTEQFQSETVDALYQFMKELEKEIPAKGRKIHLGVDGKEIRGSGRSIDSKNPKRNTAMLNIYECGTMTCVCSEPIDEKTNEIPTSQDILRKMSLAHTIVTADALHCQKKTTEIIARKRGIYVITVKENQLSLMQDMEARFESHEKEIEIMMLDKRKIEYYFLPKSYAKDGWSGMKTFVRMTSNKRKNPCIRYFISNSDDKELISEAIETRWQIENDFHKQKDVYLNEDAITCTNKNLLHNLVIMNNLILQMVNIYAAISGRVLRKAKMYFSNHPDECINTILSVMDSEETTLKLKALLRKG
jgi:predicted transposase YbfD/YdcC